MPNGDGPSETQTAIAAWTEGDVAQALELFQRDHRLGARPRAPRPRAPDHGRDLHRAGRRPARRRASPPPRRRPQLERACRSRLRRRRSGRVHRGAGLVPLPMRPAARARLPLGDHGRQPQRDRGRGLAPRPGPEPPLHRVVLDRSSSCSASAATQIGSLAPREPGHADRHRRRAPDRDGRALHRGDVRRSAQSRMARRFADGASRQGRPDRRGRGVLDRLDALRRARRWAASSPSPPSTASALHGAFLLAVYSLGLGAAVPAHGARVLAGDDRVRRRQAPLPGDHGDRRRDPDRDGRPDPERRLHRAQQAGRSASPTSSA